MNISTLNVLQTLCWPSDGVWANPALFLRRTGDVALVEHAGGTSGYALQIGPRDSVGFDTWFNVFNLGTWQSRCRLETLFVIIEGEGPCFLTVDCAGPDGVVGQSEYPLTLTSGQPEAIDLRAFITAADGGVMSCAVRSQSTTGPIRIDSVTWATADAPRRTPDLTLSVTTFKREEAVKKAAARFSAYRAASPLKPHLQMLIVDNGQSVTFDTPLDGVDIIPSANLGGAGGFTRGLLEATERSASHVLFMDDDASIYMESLERTWSFLAYAIDDTTAIAGAMSTERHPWALWEYGALFNKGCIPQLGGTDLTDVETMIEIECEIAKPAPAHLYGGWWYFAFPVKAAKHLAYPFFVRGDDVSFSLVNDFDIVRLNGVVSYQESFIEKESPQTWYLDLRSHLAHHLSIEKMDIGARGVALIALKFFLKNFVKMHYDTMSAINLAVEDVLEGPEFFANNIDMAAKRGELKALVTTEVWADNGSEFPATPVLDTPKPWIMRTIMKVLLNGHLVPGYRYLGARRTVVGDHRGAMGVYWGTAEMTVLSADGDKAYRVQHSKPRAAREGMRLVRNLVKLIRGYPALKQSYRATYENMTSENFWRPHLGLTDASPSTAATPKTAATKELKTDA